MRCSNDKGGYLVPSTINKLVMRRYAIRYSLEFFVIFLGVLVSFSVQRYGEEKDRKKHVGSSTPSPPKLSPTSNIVKNTSNSCATWQR